MFRTFFIRYVTIAAMGVLAALSGPAGAAPPPDAAEILEVKVLESPVPLGQVEGLGATYRMEVVSVIHSTSGAEPGDTIKVRATGPSDPALVPGWTGTAYLDPDPTAADSDAERQFVTSALGGSLVGLPPGPPSATFSREVPAGGQ